MRALLRARRPAYKAADSVFSKTAKHGDGIEATADDMVVQAIKKAIEERGVKVQLLYDYELVGVSRAEAAELLKARRQFTAEQGYIEAREMDRWALRGS